MRKADQASLIKKLVGLRNALDDRDTADVLLVWRGFKPAATIELSYHPKTPLSRKEFHEATAAFEGTLKKLKLRYQLHLNYPKSRTAITTYSYIARNRKTLEKLIAADTEGNTRKRRFRLGTLLGYPKTAVEAFANGKALSYRSLPKTVLQKKELRFLNFRLSKEHWRKELAYVKKAAETIKRISPELYARVIKRP